MEIDEWIGTNGKSYFIYLNGTFSRVLEEGGSVKTTEEVKLQFMRYVDCFGKIKFMEKDINKLQMFMDEHSALVKTFESVILYKAYTLTIPPFELNIPIGDEIGCIVTLYVKTKTGFTKITCDESGYIYNRINYINKRMFILDEFPRELLRYLINTKQYYDRLSKTLPLDLEFLENTKQFLEDYTCISNS